jgi:DNA-binding NarL/FixJ family response regulator
VDLSLPYHTNNYAMMIKVAVIDDNTGNRNILKNKLLHHGGFEITLTASDGKDFMHKMKGLPVGSLPDVALMDLEMPNMDGVDAIAVGSTLYPSVKFVVLTIFDDEDKIFKAIKAGAFGYLLKDENADSISFTLKQMQESSIGPISPGIAHKILKLVQKNELSSQQNSQTDSKNIFFDLTQREKEILQLLVQGLLYKEIGAHLYISANTAKKHVMNIYQKLHINSRAQAMHLAVKKGFL